MLFTPEFQIEDFLDVIISGNKDDVKDVLVYSFLADSEVTICHLLFSEMQNTLLLADIVMMYSLLSYQGAILQLESTSFYCVVIIRKKTSIKMSSLVHLVLRRYHIA